MKEPQPINLKEWMKENSPNAKYGLEGFQLSPARYDNKPLSLSSGIEARVDYSKKIPAISFRGYQGKNNIYSERDELKYAA